MIKITFDTIVKQHPDVVSADVGDDVMLLAVKSDSYFDMPDTAALIWRQIEEPTTISQVCNALMEHYDVDEETCRTATLTFLEQLLEEGIVDVVAAE